MFAGSGPPENTRTDPSSETSTRSDTRRSVAAVSRPSKRVGSPNPSLAVRVNRSTSVPLLTAITDPSIDVAAGPNDRSSSVNGRSNRTPAGFEPGSTHRSRTTTRAGATCNAAASTAVVSKSGCGTESVTLSVVTAAPSAGVSSTGTWSCSGTVCAAGSISLVSAGTDQVTMQPFPLMAGFLAPSESGTGVVEVASTVPSAAVPPRRWTNSDESEPSALGDDANTMVRPSCDTAGAKSKPGLMMVVVASA